MKLSIIIPVYNEEKTVGLLLEKVVNAKIPVDQREIIVVNDGSVDQTGYNIKQAKSRLRNFTIITHPKNQGKEQRSAQG